LNICGYSKPEDTDATCIYKSLGKTVVGEWIDWVVEIDMVAYDTTGYVNVWRNNEQIVAATNVATSYNRTNAPYVKIGTYSLQWKFGFETGTTWNAFDFASIRVGDISSSYNEVYTGNGALCGAPCQGDDDAVTNDDIVGDDNESKDKKHFDLNDVDGELVLMSAVPVLCIMICVCMFYWANRAIDKKYEHEFESVFADAETTGLDDANASNPKDVLERQRSQSYTPQRSRAYTATGARTRTFTMASRQSSMQGSLVAMNALRDTFVWAEEEDFVHDSQFVWEEPWQATMQRKIFWYIFGYGSVMGMILFSMVLYGNPVTDEDGLLPWTKVHEWTVKDIATYMTVTFTYTGIFFIPLLFLPQQIDEGKNFKNDPEYLRRIGVVIPCHKSALEIGGVVKQVLKYIPAENICICDNGNFNWPADNTFEVVKAIDPKIQYCFISQGHKTRALWTGCHRLPKRCQYIIHLDDDTLLSDHMVFDETHFKRDGGEHVSAVAFLRSSHRENRLTNFTDFWYKITDHFHATQAKIATRAFVPGPAGMWRRDRFIEVFGAHPALPFGEDIFGGFTTLNMGYAIRAETRCMVTTFAPGILVNCAGGGRVQGYGASSLWKQRAHRWTVSALRITGKSLYSFFTYDTKGGILSNIAFRMYRFREYKIIFVQVMYIPFCVVILSRGFIIEFFLLKFMLFIWPLLRNLYINYICWRNQPQLQVKLETVLLSPFFNFFLIMCAVHGRLKCLLWYIPNVPPNHGMLQRCHPRSKKTIKTLDCTPRISLPSATDTDQSSMAFVGNNPLNQDANIGATPDATNDLFEFFYRDGSSVYVSYSSGGMDEGHRRNTIVTSEPRVVSEHSAGSIRSSVRRKSSAGNQFEAIEEDDDNIVDSADTGDIELGVPDENCDSIGDQNDDHQTTRQSNSESQIVTSEDDCIVGTSHAL